MRRKSSMKPVHELSNKIKRANRINNIKANLFFIVIILITSIVVWYSFLSGIEKEIEVNCIKLQQYEEEYPLFWSTDKEKETCKEFGIILIK